MEQLQQWLTDYPLVTYLFIVACLIYVFNAVFRPRKLPLLKDVLVYVLILLGGWLLLFFQIRVGLPIVHGFAVAILLMIIVRVRSWITRRSSGKDQDDSGKPPSSPVRTEPGVVRIEDQAGERS